MGPLVPVMKSAAELVHSVFEKELKPNWEHSIHKYLQNILILKSSALTLLNFQNV